MNVGVDFDGRAIDYDEASGGFLIGGIPATIERLIGYDCGGQVKWTSPQVREWAYQYETNRVAYVGREHAAQAAVAADYAARVNAAARRAELTAQGYSHTSTLGLASQFRGLAVLVILGFGFGGAAIGGSLGTFAQTADAAVIMSLVFGVGGLLAGYLATLVYKAIAHVLSTLVQSEMNTRRDP